MVLVLSSGRGAALADRSFFAHSDEAGRALERDDTLTGGKTENT